MQVELGNPAPQDAASGAPSPGPCVTYMNGVSSSLVHGTEASAHFEHFAQFPGAVTHLPGHEAIITVVRSWQAGQSMGNPSWVKVNLESPDEDPAAAAELERQLGNFWACPQGRPDDLEETHWTVHGPHHFPPGSKP